MVLISSAYTAVIREYVNALWAIFAAEMMLLIIWRTWHEWKRIEAPSTWARFWAWRADPVVAAAIAFSVYLLADTISRTWVWMLLRAVNDGQRIPDNGLIPISACAVAIVAALCSFRVFVPLGYRNKVMIAGIAAAVAIVLVFELI